MWILTFLLYALLFVPLLDVPFKLQIQAWLPYLFLSGLAIFAMGGAVEVLRRKL
jgi:hypothetical protein